MSFIWSNLLVFLVLIPLLVIVYFRLQRRRREAANHFGSLGLLRDTRGRRPGTSRHIPILLLLSGIAVLILSALLKRHYRLTVLDANGRNLDAEQCRAELRRWQPAYVLVTVVSYLAE